MNENKQEATIVHKKQNYYSGILRYEVTRGNILFHAFQISINLDGT